MTLLPDCDVQSMTYQFGVANSLNYQIQILDTAPYTTTIRMEQKGATAAYLKPQMDVRLYHDARMAEVMSSQHAGAFKPAYPYPNADMRQRDEKERVNCFLAEWLVFCLKHRQTVSSNID
jgi:uncharacterized protein YqiB (DUF1249 family)